MALSLRGNKKKLQGKAVGEIPAKFRKQKAVPHRTERRF
jgi:hypothetical protein